MAALAVTQESPEHRSLPPSSAPSLQDLFATTTQAADDFTKTLCELYGVALDSSIKTRNALLVTEVMRTDPQFSVRINELLEHLQQLCSVGVEFPLERLVRLTNLTRDTLASMRSAAFTKKHASFSLDGLQKLRSVTATLYQGLLRQVQHQKATQPCRSLQQGVRCRFGNKCWYSHELKPTTSSAAPEGLIHSKELPTKSAVDDHKPQDKRRKQAGIAKKRDARLTLQVNCERLEVAVAFYVSTFNAVVKKRVATAKPPRVELDLSEGLKLVLFGASGKAQAQDQTTPLLRLQVLDVHRFVEVAKQWDCKIVAPVSPDAHWRNAQSCTILDPQNLVWQIASKAKKPVHLTERVTEEPDKSPTSVKTSDEKN